MKILKITQIVVLFTTTLFAQPDFFGNIDNHNVQNKLFFDVINYKSETTEKTLSRFFVEVPYQSLSFIKKGSIYESVYNVDVTILENETENVVAEKIWSKKIVVENYEITSSTKAIDISFKDFELAPNEYKMKVMLEDTYSLNRIQFSANLTIREIKTEVAISDILLLNEIKKTADGKESLVPNIKNKIDSGIDSLLFYYEIYSTSQIDILVNYQIYGKTDDESFLLTDLISLKQGKNSIIKAFNNVDFMLGKYTLTIKIANETKTTLAEIKKEFSSHLQYFPSSIVDLNLSVEEMIYIAPQEIIDDIQKTKEFAKKLDKFKKFWESKDPTPGSLHNEVLIEYFRRVEYSNKNFKHYFPGWKTDMGKVYISLGQPNQVDKHPLELNRKPYEVWNYYAMNLQFVFIDETGFGDFRLSSPTYSDWYRYRQ